MNWLNDGFLFHSFLFALHNAKKHDPKKGEGKPHHFFVRTTNDVTIHHYFFRPHLFSSQFKTKLKIMCTLLRFLESTTKNWYFLVRNIWFGLIFICLRYNEIKMSVNCFMPIVLRVPS